MNPRKKLGCHCSSRHLSLSSNPSTGPRGSIHHSHGHSALGVGLSGVCLVLVLCYTTYCIIPVPSTTLGTERFMKLGDLFDPQSLTCGQIPSGPPILSNLLNLSYLSSFLPAFLSFFFPYFLYIHKSLLHTYQVPILCLLIEL